MTTTTSTMVVAQQTTLMKRIKVEIQVGCTLEKPNNQRKLCTSGNLKIKP